MFSGRSYPNDGTTLLRPRPGEKGYYTENTEGLLYQQFIEIEMQGQISLDKKENKLSGTLGRLNENERSRSAEFNPAHAWKISIKTSHKLNFVISIFPSGDLIN